MNDLTSTLDMTKERIERNKDLKNLYTMSHRKRKR